MQAVHTYNIQQFVTALMTRLEFRTMSVQAETVAWLFITCRCKYFAVVDDQDPLGYRTLTCEYVVAGLKEDCTGQTGAGAEGACL